MAATHRFGEVRVQVIDALASANPEVRAAAVATLNEANDAAAHDLIVALANDSDTHVREEVLEYICEFPMEADTPLLLRYLQAKSHLFLASSALIKLFGGIGPLIDDEESENQSAAILEWERLLRARDPTA